MRFQREKSPENMVKVQFGARSILGRYWVNFNRLLSLVEFLERNLTLTTVFWTRIMHKFAGAYLRGSLTARILRIGMVDRPYPKNLRIDCDEQEFLIFNDFIQVGPLQNYIF